MAEGYIIPEQRMSMLEEANQAPRNGDRQKAMQTLRAASIDVIVAATMIPAQKSLEHIKKANELIGQDKYYKANVALKAIEDSAVNRSFALDAMPPQGQSGQDGQNSSGDSQSKSSG